ncbi:MAG: BPTI/Kunitz domain-containing protein [Flavobacteriales bacterium]|nr:BPTI/Kunitz domain-containing protein [Flavobacteriales bacterium]
MKINLRASIFMILAILGEAGYAQSACDLAPDPGPCFAAIEAYYFNQDSQSCDSFTWGGCGGVVPFDTLAECENACGEGEFNPNELCDSIIVTVNSVVEPEYDTPGIVTISMSTTYSTSYTFPYAGFQLMDAEGMIIASEALNSAPNVYGIGPNMNETRYLILPSSLPSPFSGQLNLLIGLFAGLPQIVACSYPITWSDSSTSILNLSDNDHQSRSKIQCWYDLMGRQLQHGPPSGQFCIALLKDGSRKVVWQQ